MEIYLKAADFIGGIFSFVPKLLVLYLVIINILTFALYYADKQKAKKHKWRIPESTLLLTAFIGGSFGAFGAMRVFRHKTQHPKFYILVPFFMILHAAVIITGIIGITNK